MQQKRGVGDLEAGVAGGCKPSFSPLSLELNPRAKKGWKQIEKGGSGWKVLAREAVRFRILLRLYCE